MEEKKKIIKKIIESMSWVMNNKYLKSTIKQLLGNFLSTDSEISVVSHLDRILNVELNNQNDKLIISFLSDYNEFDVKYIFNSGNSFKCWNIKRDYDEVEVLETESYNVKLDSEVIGIIEIEKYKKYVKNFLIKATFEELFEVDPSFKKSYSIYEEIYTVPSGHAVLKRNIKGQENSDYKTELIYLKTDSLSDILFDDVNCDNENTQFFTLSNEEEYTKFLMKHKVSLLPVRCVNIEYVDNINEIKCDTVILFAASNDYIECIIGDEVVNITYDRICSISYGGETIYKNLIEKDKIKHKD